MIIHLIVGLIKKTLYKMSQYLPKPDFKRFLSLNLKTEVDKLDIDKLATVPVDLSKLSNVLKNDAIKKTAYDKLVAKVNNINTSGLVKKIDYNTKIIEIEDKIPDSSSFV